MRDYAWYSGNSNQKVHLIQQKIPNAFGLYDTHGNIWKFCHSQYNTEDKKFYRGGAWSAKASNCKSNSRDYESPDYKTYDLGFAYVLT